MSAAIPEPDWKAYKGIQERAQERACEAVLAKASQLLGEQDRSAHDRFRDLCRLFEKEEQAFDRYLTEFRRSTAVQTLAIMFSRGLLTEEDLSQLSDETRRRIESICGGAP